LCELDKIEKFKVPRRVPGENKSWCSIRLVVFSIMVDLKKLGFLGAGKEEMRWKSTVN
jgi:hypothetical protein